MSDQQSRRPTGSVLVGLFLVLALLPGCGSSKPAYCAKVSDLKTSLQAAAKLETVTKGASAVSSAVGKVKSSADALVGAAKSDFPSETSAITSAVDRLSKSARQLSSSPKVTIAALPLEIGAAVAAVNNFASATSSKCG